MFKKSVPTAVPKELKRKVKEIIASGISV